MAFHWWFYHWYFVYRVKCHWNLTLLIFTYFAYILRCNDQILHRTAWPSHCICFQQLQYICRSNDLLNREYSRLLFSYIIYFPNNTGERCVFIINFHIGKYDALNILLMLFFYIVVYRPSLTLLIINVSCIHFALKQPKLTLNSLNITLYIISLLTKRSSI